MCPYKVANCPTNSDFALFLIVNSHTCIIYNISYNCAVEDLIKHVNKIRCPIIPASTPSPLIIKVVDDMTIDLLLTL